MKEQDRRAIERFVREGLGCHCPPAVFESIVVAPRKTPEGGPRYLRVDVGSRLLVCLLMLDPVSEEATPCLERLATHLLAERDAGAFNRLRLVLALPVAGPRLPGAYAAFLRATGPDDRAHLHVISESALPAGLAAALGALHT